MQLLCMDLLYAQEREQQYENDGFLIGILQAAKLAALSWLALPVCIVLLFVILMLIRAKTGREEV